MRVIAVTLALVAAGATGVLAQSGSTADPIAARTALMKTQGDQTKIAVRMVKGEEPFDAQKAAAVFAAYISTTEKFGALFPENSKTGDTRAAPAIWTDRAGFDAALAEFTEDVKANQGKTGTLDEFKTALSAVTSNCGSCHETYRIKR